MKKIAFSSLLLLFLSDALLGMWALIPLEQLVDEADLIVVGTLYDAEEDDEGIGKGYIKVDAIVSGKAKGLSGVPLAIGDSLRIRWADNWACAAGMHMRRKGEQAVWLLDVEDDGSVAAGQPGKFQPAKA